jgi:hypothetical protein
MNEAKWERWGAASGLASLAVGAAGGALERGWPSASDPAAVAAFIADKRAEILAQSMLFVLSAALFLWFLGSLRGFLARAEGEPAPLSTVVFGTGAVWVGLSMVAQAFQVGQAMDPNAGVQPTLLWTMAAMFSIANLPLAVMLLAVAVVSLRNRAFPRWLGWLSVVAASAQTVLWLGAVGREGPLAPNGWLIYVLYPLFAVWLVPTAIVMLKWIGKPSARGDVSKEGPHRPADTSARQQLQPQH